MLVLKKSVTCAFASSIVILAPIYVFTISLVPSDNILYPNPSFVTYGACDCSGGFLSILVFTSAIVDKSLLFKLNNKVLSLFIPIFNEPSIITHELFDFQYCHHVILKLLLFKFIFVEQYWFIPLNDTELLLLIYIFEYDGE